MDTQSINQAGQDLFYQGIQYGLSVGAYIIADIANISGSVETGNSEDMASGLDDLWDQFSGINDASNDATAQYQNTCDQLTTTYEQSMANCG